jgi:hypothetical protein
MINVKTEVHNTLKNNTDLTTLLGGERIYFMVVPEKKAAEFPRLTYYEYSNRAEDYADDEELSSEIRIVIDVWSKTSTTDIAIKIVEIMESIGFRREDARDLYEDDTKVYHKYLRFVTVKML